MRDQPFRIVCYLDENTATWNGTDWDFTPTGPTTIATDLFVYKETLDVSGWSKQDLTAFFANQNVQRPKTYTATGTINMVTDPALPDNTGGIAASDTLIVSDVPLTVDANLQDAGFMAHDSDYTTIKLAQGILVTQTINAPQQMTITDSWNYGSGEPTASDTLYLYRVIYITKGTRLPGDSIDFPELRYVAQGIAAEEDDYVYLNRLRRSYELQQS